MNIEQSFLCYTVGPCWLSILNIAVLYVTKKRCMAGPAACHSKVNKQARLVEKKGCFISDAGDLRVGGGLRTSVQRLTPHPLRQARGESFYRQSQGEVLHVGTA